MNSMNATVITNLAICGVVVGAIYLTMNPLALAGLMLLRAIPLDDATVCADAIGQEEGENEEDHVRREVGFNAKYKS